MFRPKGTMFVIILMCLAVSAVRVQGPAKVAQKNYKVNNVVDTRGSVSPDGRFLTYVDWTTGDLAARDLSSGESRRLTNKGESTEYGVYSIISPDSKQVAYMWWMGWSKLDCPYDLDFFYDLRITSLDGSGPRVFFPNKEIGVSWVPHDWSPDGKHILAILEKRDGTNQITNQIVLVSVTDGSVRVLKTLDRGSPLAMKFSPDGHYIAYDLPPQEDFDEHDVFLLSIESRQEIALVRDPSDDFLLGWAPDGKRVLFASDRTGTLGIWVIEVGYGKSHGALELVKPGIERLARSLGFTRDGSYYYGLWTWVNDVYVATFDSGTGKLQAPKKQVTDVGFTTSVEWSPDGQYFAYVSGYGSGSDPFILRIRSVETGKERRLRVRVGRQGPLWFQLHWSPDGQSLVAAGGHSRQGIGRNGIYRIDIETGKVTPIVEVKPLVQPHACCVVSPAWSRDGKLIFARYATGIMSGPRRIMARDLETDSEKELYHTVSTATVSNLAVSPDGQRLAFIWRDSKERKTVLKVMSAGGGEPRELFGVQAPERIWQLTWTPDGRHILFGKGTAGQKQRFALWQISPEGGEPQELGLSMEGLVLYGLSVHPDGQRIVFTAGGPLREEVWVLKDFLPALKTTK